MFKKLDNIVLIACIGLIGADRIDLFFGRGPFQLTPFLVLAPLVIFSKVSSKWLHGSMSFRMIPSVKRQRSFVILCSLFLFLILVSIPFGLDPARGIVLFVNLVLVASLGYCLSVLILIDSDPEKLVLNSVSFALVMYFVFCGAECVAWSHGLVILPNQTRTWVENTFSPEPLGLLVPRLSGTIFDPNRAGFVLTMYLALLDRFTTRSRYTRFLHITIGILVLLTISRSGVLCWLTYYLFTSTALVRLTSRRSLAWLSAVALLILLVCIPFRKEIQGIADAWEISDALYSKLSMDEGTSGGSHVLLIQRGFDTWRASPKSFLTGIGYGSGNKVLEDILGEDKHINFHSLYVTILAEAGLPAFMLIMLLLIYPIIGRRGSTSLVLAIMIFNIGYQSHTDPIFWSALALAWSSKTRHLPWLKTANQAQIMAQPGGTLAT
jgi:O-Antigen ligase